MAIDSVGAPYGVAELARTLHAGAAIFRALGMLKAYFDESGTHGDAPVVTIAGYVGTESAWSAIEALWRPVLAEYADKGVKFFHTSEALAQRGQFARLEKPFIHHMMTALSQILGEGDVRAIYSAVDVLAWDDADKSPEFLARYPSALSLCFDDVVRSLANWAKARANGEEVAPVFAYSEEYAKGFGLGADVLQLYGAQDWYKEALACLGFGWPEKVIPLQGADLFAHAMTGEIDRRLGGIADKSAYLDLAKGGVAPVGHYFDEEALKLTMKRFADSSGEIYPMG